jgi:hypothetical protein
MGGVCFGFMTIPSLSIVQSKQEKRQKKENETPPVSLRTARRTSAADTAIRIAYGAESPMHPPRPPSEFTIVAQSYTSVLTGKKKTMYEIEKSLGRGVHRVQPPCLHGVREWAVRCAGFFGLVSVSLYQSAYHYLTSVHIVAHLFVAVVSRLSVPASRSIDI